jgi:glycine cleavage system H lipoate-binding protein/ABC-type phosphate transport system substrate-binding protein
LKYSIIYEYFVFGTLIGCWIDIGLTFKAYIIMKTILGNFIVICIMLLGLAGYTENPVQNPKDKVLKIGCSEEYMGLLNTWATEYELANPGIKLRINNDFSLQSPDNDLIIAGKQEVLNEQLWSMSIGRDAIVAIMNPLNPEMQQISKCGLSPKKLSSLLLDLPSAKWGIISGGKSVAPVHLYIAGGESLKTAIANFAKTEDSFVPGTIDSWKEIQSSIQTDKYALGFCKLEYLTSGGKLNIPQNMVIIPIDKNGNGRIDRFENIYSNPEEMIHGMWLGKYPGTLLKNINVYAQSKPSDPLAMAFIEWIMNNGQTYLAGQGLLELSSNEKKENIVALNGEVTPDLAQQEAKNTSALLILLIAGGIIALFITLWMLFGRHHKVQEHQVNNDSNASFNEKSVCHPNGLYYDKTHTWAFMEREGNVRIGIDDFLQHITGSLTNVRMKSIGENIIKGEMIMTIIHEGKQLNIYSPVSGIVREINNNISKDASLLNVSPYSEGWVYLVEPANWARETQFLFLSDKYNEWLRDEFKRLREFLLNIGNQSSTLKPQLILQDGGEIADHPLANLQPEVWEDFQTYFIDSSR